jgi:hypothetical protein
VEDQIQVARVLLDLRKLECAARVFNRQRMEVEDVVEQREFVIAGG